MVIMDGYLIFLPEIYPPHSVGIRAYSRTLISTHSDLHPQNILIRQTVDSLSKEKTLYSILQSLIGKLLDDIPPIENMLRPLHCSAGVMTGQKNWEDCWPLAVGIVPIAVAFWAISSLLKFVPASVMMKSGRPRYTLIHIIRSTSHTVSADTLSSQCATLNRVASSTWSTGLPLIYIILMTVE